MHTSVVHPEKRSCGWGGAGGAGGPRRAAAAAAARHGAPCAAAASAWQWHAGRALLPFAFRLRLVERDAATHEGGVGGLSWEAWNRSAVRRYNKLHEHREDERYCDELPCGGPMRSERQV